MNVKITKQMYDAVGIAALKPFGLDESSFRYGRSACDLNLAEFTLKAVTKFKGLFQAHMKVRGVKPMFTNIEVWESILNDTAKCPKNIDQFTTMLKETMRKVPGHRVYRKDDEDRWLAYLVNDIKYHPQQVVGKGEERRVIPPYCTVEFLYEELGTGYTERASFGDDYTRIGETHFSAQTIFQSLIAKGWYPENDNFRAEYLKTHKRTEEMVQSIGKQFMATGEATDDVDGNDDDDDEKQHSWGYRGGTNTFKMEREGQPSRVVIDVMSESEKAAKEGTQANYAFWQEVDYQADRMGARPDAATNSKDDDDEEIDEADEDEDTDRPKKNAATILEVPVHPACVVFDLRRHMRLRVYSDQLTDYKYDKQLGDKLILPQENHDLVEMLLSHKGAWKDVIGGKGGGAIILCAGVPGTGKTLTSEVYSEVMERPLYSVQCSQLGMTPEDLEKQLLKVFSRAGRWKAVLLLDEADVYVRARGDDLAQNAIVGVFLRVLEYYQSVLFLTTNRADLVDDAVASRCVAKITYDVPNAADQREIWKVLSQTMGVLLPIDTINKIVKENEGLTGRDVKNLLKLAILVSSSRGTPIDSDTIKFVKRFKPTAGK
jgi:SpoVK/Ycf46/Vps4 family AAA+-type ATPase